MSSNYKIGYVDEDKNQVNLYGRKLRDFGFDVIGYDFRKGMLIEELMDQIYTSDIDLLMIDFKLNESNVVAFNGDEVERAIYENRPLFPHIIFTNKSDQAEPQVDDLKIIFDKEIVFPREEEDGVQTKRFIDTLNKSIDQYKGYISKRKNIISDLLDKEQNEDLSLKDRNLLLSTQSELINLDKMMILDVPETLKSTDELQKIEKAREEADAYIKMLLEQKKDENKR